MDERTNPSIPGHTPEQAPDRDVLISRAIDASASASDWDALRAIAERDPGVWSEIADTQRQHDRLVVAIEDELAAVDGFELDDALLDPQPLLSRVDTLAKWGGWAAAAMLALVWITDPGVLSNRFGSPDASTNTASMLPTAGPSDPDEALNQYLEVGGEAGRVVREVPDRVVVSATPNDDGSVEVLYLRQILERETVARVYAEVQDEHGRSRNVPAVIADPPARVNPDRPARTIW